MNERAKSLGMVDTNFEDCCGLTESDNHYTTGLKTGSTSKGKYCLSATAIKEDVELIAVIMAAPDYKVRFLRSKNNVRIWI